MKKSKHFEKFIMLNISSRYPVKISILNDYYFLNNNRKKNKLVFLKWSLVNFPAFRYFSTFLQSIKKSNEILINYLLIKPTILNLLPETTHGQNNPFNPKK